MGIKEVKRQANIRKWTAVFSDRNASGLTVRQYCDEHGITKDQYEQGSIYLFCGRRADRIKALVYEGDGFTLLYKRLADGRFQWPRNETEVKDLTQEQFQALMDGFAPIQKKTIKNVAPTRV